MAVPKHSEPSDRKEEKAQENAQKAERVDDVEVSCHASAGAKWHLELLAVSAELKEKLQDPQFVATRCDLDGSGDLDAHELKQAARVYGISQSGSSENHDGTNPRLMAGQRVSKESFAEMVASQGSTKLIRTFDSNTIKVLLGGTCPQNALTCISILDGIRRERESQHQRPFPVKGGTRCQKGCEPRMESTQLTTMYWQYAREMSH